MPTNSVRFTSKTPASGSQTVMDVFPDTLGMERPKRTLSGGASKLAGSIAIGLVTLALAYFLYVRQKKPTERQFKSTDEFVRWLANEAVRDAREQSHVELDYSVESIQKVEKVEKVLASLHDQYAKNPSSISANGLGSAYGAYIGEVIRRTEPGAHWERDDPIGEKSYPIIWGDGNSYPMAWCYHRIVNGPEDNVWVKYRVLKDRRTHAASSDTK